MIKSDAYKHFENKKLKKINKLDTCFKKIILIDYRDYLIYYLYNREINSIFVSCSININKNSMLKKIITAKVFEIEFFIIEFTDFFTNSFINSFIESFMTDFFSQDNESIIKNMTLSV